MSLIAAAGLSAVFDTVPMNTVLRFGSFELRPAARLLLRDGQEVAIGGRAFDLLCVLAQRHPQVVSHTELLEAAWSGGVVEPNNLQVQIWALRRLLGPQAIFTVARRGYRFAPERIGHALEPAGLELPPVDGTPALNLAPRFARHRLVTLVGRDPAALLEWAEVQARQHADQTGVAVWHLSHAAHAADAALHALIERLRSRADVLLWPGTQRQAQDLRQWLDLTRERAPGLRWLSTALEPLGHPEESVVQAPERAADDETLSEALAFRLRRGHCAR